MVITLEEAYYIAAVLEGHIWRHDKATADYTLSQLRERADIAKDFLQRSVSSSNEGVRQMRAEWLHKHLGGKL